MKETQFSPEQIKELIEGGQISDPLLFFDAVMKGTDPRQQSELFTLVMEIEEFSNGGAPSVEDWNEVVNFVLRHYRFEKVKLSESQAAAKSLAEYIYAKRKHTEVEINGGVASIKDNPLTPEEVDIFLEKFDDEF